MLLIDVKNVIFGDRDVIDAVPDITFWLPETSLSVRDLIARSVELQINELLEQKHSSIAKARALLDRQYIGEQELGEQARDGKIAMPRSVESAGKPVDVQFEIDRALKAFSANRFKVFINGREFDDLDEQLSFDEAIKVKFMRVMPLAGG